MSSTIYRESHKAWIADIRALWDPPGKRSKIRIPDVRILSPATAQQDADAYAAELERYCRLLERTGHTVDLDDVAHAKRIGAITPEQAEALIRGTHKPSRSVVKGPLLIRDAAVSHPSAKREELAQQIQHLRYLDGFIAHTGITRLADVTIEHVEAWVAEMKRKGWAWDSRRHGLLYLRLAARMGTRAGIADQLYGLRLDERDAGRREISAGSMAQLADLLIGDIDDRTRAALGLMGCVGLRPSEMTRLDPVDLVDGAAHVGAAARKNDPSERWLPLPPTVLGWVQKALGGRTEGPVITPIGPRRKHRYDYTGLRLWLAPILTRHFGVPLSPKSLRKTFANWAAEFIPNPMDHERWIGHKTQFRANVTERHYMKRYQIEQFRPAMTLIEKALMAELEKAKARKEARDAG